MRKLAVLPGALLVLGAPFAVQGQAQAADTGAISVCITVTVVGLQVCVPGAPTPPGVPQLPQLPAPPPLPVPTLPLPPTQIPPTPLPGGNSSAVTAAKAGGLCNYDPARPTPPPAGEQTLTLPDGTTIYGYFNLDPSTQTATGYLGGTNAMVGTLEGGGTASPAGASGQVDGTNGQTGLSGYLGSNGACLGM